MNKIKKKKSISWHVNNLILKNMMNQMVDYPISIKFSLSKNKLVLSPEIKHLPRRESKLLRNFLGKIRKLRKKSSFLCFQSNSNKKVKKKDVSMIFDEFKTRLSLCFKVINRCPVYSSFRFESIFIIFIYHFNKYQFIRKIEIAGDKTNEITDKEELVDENIIRQRNRLLKKISIT